MVRLGGPKILFQIYKYIYMYTSYSCIIVLKSVSSFKIFYRFSMSLMSFHVLILNSRYLACYRHVASPDHMAADHGGFVAKNQFNRVNRPSGILNMESRVVALALKECK